MYQGAVVHREPLTPEYPRHQMEYSEYPATVQFKANDEYITVTECEKNPARNPRLFRCISS